jgi:hypothetical protein
MLLKRSGKIKVNLYYTYNGKYSLLSKDVELSSEWKEVSFKLDEGLEFGLGMLSRPDVVMPYKVVICFLWGSVYCKGFKLGYSDWLGSA